MSLLDTALHLCAAEDNRDEKNLKETNVAKFGHSRVASKLREPEPERNASSIGY